ncbi:MAG: aspartate dehydrogenase [Candidatus Micrarchaeota archaeon]
MVYLKIGIIGCGAIGTAIAKAVKEGRGGDARVVMVFDTDTAKAKELASKTGSKISTGAGELILKSDLVVECASQNAVREYGPKVAGKKDFMVLSVGALLDEKLRTELITKAKAKGKKIYVPSGAVCGLDGLKGARVGEIDSVKLTTTKPPKSLGLDISEKNVVFSGTPEEAVKKFPANINVSAALRLVSGNAKVTVEIVADPSAKLNKHEILAVGDFGGLACRTENLPSKDNPKTSALAAMSAVATIKRLTETLIIGT